MLYILRGKLTVKEPNMFVVECGGVGYKCTCSMYTISQLPKVGDETFVFTYLNVREDAVDLFGFSNKNELSCFKQLISVSGVGPKAATSILSTISYEQLAVCIATGDYKSITKAQGVGTKTAQRIVLELKDKIKTEDIVNGFNSSPILSKVDNPNVQDAISALMVLGFSNSEASNAISSCNAEMSTEEIIKIGLKNLSSKR